MASASTASKDSRRLEPDYLVRALITICEAVKAPVVVNPLIGSGLAFLPLLARVVALHQVLRSLDKDGDTDEIPGLWAKHNDEFRTLSRNLEDWEPQDRALLSDSCNPQADIEEVTHNSEAFRYAAMLLLQQDIDALSMSEAIPVTRSRADLSMKVLTFVRRVSLSSSLIIGQVFPLVVADSEVTYRNERDWVLERLDAIQDHLSVSYIGRIKDTLEQTWTARDDWGRRYEGKRRRCQPFATPSELMPEFDDEHMPHWLDIMHQHEGIGRTYSCTETPILCRSTDLPCGSIHRITGYRDAINYQHGHPQLISSRRER